MSSKSGRIKLVVEHHSSTRNMNTQLGGVGSFAAAEESDGLRRDFLKSGRSSKGSIQSTFLGLSDRTTVPEGAGLLKLCRWSIDDRLPDCHVSSHETTDFD